MSGVPPAQHPPLGRKLSLADRAAAAFPLVAAAAARHGIGTSIINNSPSSSSSNESRIPPAATQRDAHSLSHSALLPLPALSRHSASSAANIGAAPARSSTANPSPNHPAPEDSAPYSMNPSDYALGPVIGQGSSATVYLATYKPSHRPVSIKVIDLDLFERNQIDELRREIQIMSLSRHPNLLPVYGSFVNGSKLFIVTPFLAGGSCLDIMKTSYKSGFDEASIATILKQALMGLDYLHKNGLIHRDVKAGNLLLDRDGLVQLADFGVSSSLMETGDRRGLRKTFVGTPCWMAPEVMEQSGYDYKADIWSFGITALELAYGHAPYAMFPPLKVLMLTLQNEPPVLDRDATTHKYSKGFKEMIDLCLKKDPSKRPTTEKLLQLPFFKGAKKPGSLIASVITNMVPITQRQQLLNVGKANAAAAAAAAAGSSNSVASHPSDGTAAPDSASAAAAPTASPASAAADAMITPVSNAQDTVSSDISQKWDFDESHSESSPAPITRAQDLAPPDASAVLTKAQDTVSHIHSIMRNTVASEGNSTGNDPNHHHHHQQLEGNRSTTSRPLGVSFADDPQQHSDAADSDSPSSHTQASHLIDPSTQSPAAESLPSPVAIAGTIMPRKSRFVVDAPSLAPDASNAQSLHAQAADGTLTSDMTMDAQSGLHAAQQQQSQQPQSQGLQLSTSPRLSNSTNALPAEVRKGRFSVFESGASASAQTLSSPTSDMTGSAGNPGPMLPMAQPLSGASAAAAAAAAAAMQQSSTLERKSGRFAIQTTTTMSNSSYASSGFPGSGVIDSVFDPDTMLSLQASAPGYGPRSDFPPQPMPYGSVASISTNDKRGRFEITSSIDNAAGQNPGAGPAASTAIALQNECESPSGSHDSASFYSLPRVTRQRPSLATSHTGASGTSVVTGSSTCSAPPPMALVLRTALSPFPTVDLPVHERVDVLQHVAEAQRYVLNELLPIVNRLSINPFQSTTTAMDSGASAASAALASRAIGSDGVEGAAFSHARTLSLPSAVAMTLVPTITNTTLPSSTTVMTTPAVSANMSPAMTMDTDTRLTAAFNTIQALRTENEILRQRCMQTASTHPSVSLAYAVSSTPLPASSLSNQITPL